MSIHIPAESTKNFSAVKGLVISIETFPVVVRKLTLIWRLSKIETLTAFSIICTTTWPLPAGRPARPAGFDCYSQTETVACPLFFQLLDLRFSVSCIERHSKRAAAIFLYKNKPSTYCAGFSYFKVKIVNYRRKIASAKTCLGASHTPELHWEERKTF